MSFKSLEEFVSSFKEFNDMYKIGNSKYLLGKEKSDLSNFQKIIEEEIAEGNDISFEKDNLEFMTELSDWLGDIVVYCFTKAYSLGIPLIEVLSIIMNSNKSKLDEDGKPIYHPETHKVMKGPNYWKPEPKIKELLEQYKKE